jgi:hypothetical protein
LPEHRRHEATPVSATRHLKNPSARPS